MSENAQVYISHGVGWSHIGETDGPIQWQPFPPGPDVAAEQPLAIQWPISMTITVDATGSAETLAQLYRMVHDVDLAYRPRRHGHCRTCHPEMDVRPLAVDGHDYDRRRKARMRRKRGR